MLIRDLESAGALPVLEMAMRFSGQRQRLITHNIANLSTPNFQPADVSPGGFQDLLADAIDARRRRTGGEHGQVDWQETGEIKRPDRGNGRYDIQINAKTPSGNILFHDRNNRDLERSMQALVENAAYFRTAVEFMRQQRTLIENAIAESV